jgi:type I restriction enzyme S subunit
MSWKSLLLGEMVDEGLINIQTGPFGTQLKASDYTEAGTPVINVRNIGYGSLKPDKLEHVPDAVCDRLEKHLLSKDDIVFGRKGAVDRHLLVQEPQSGWMQGSDCIRLRFLSNNIVPKFLSYSLLMEQHKSWILTQCSNKATMASLNQDVICRIPLKVPDLVVQKAIVEILSTYDDLIENNRRRIQLLEESARLLYKEWFVHLRFPGHEHMEIVDGVPEGWNKRPLGETLTLQRGFDLPLAKRKPGRYPIFASTGINGYHEQAKVKAPGVVTGRSGSLSRRAQLFVKRRRLFKKRQTIDAQGFGCTKLSSI